MNNHSFGTENTEPLFKMLKEASNKVFGLFMAPWRGSRKRKNAPQGQQPAQYQIARRKSLTKMASFGKKRRSDMSDLMVSKRRKSTNSGFLDRAFENAWYLPEDELEEERLVMQVAPYVTRGD